MKSCIDWDDLIHLCKSSERELPESRDFTNAKKKRAPFCLSLTFTPTALSPVEKTSKKTSPFSLPNGFPPETLRSCAFLRVKGRRPSPPGF
ncbi:Acid-sensing ion channel 3 [Manis javanica]|nr:Acid-sensing ion channel 3 [Manis javanica]